MKPYRVRVDKSFIYCTVAEASWVQISGRVAVFLRDAEIV